MHESNCTYLLCFRVYSINAMTNYVRTILHLAYKLTLADIYILIEQFILSQKNPYRTVQLPTLHNYQHVQLPFTCIALRA